ncbi:hypothetical protein OSB04_008761 [Centaurea solstitialis]|uniref:Uncharacterized protein n=1 Tax=Centaurea solstitialis TaxID=347529 RepID=A0AA38WU21_9ASTR|nr:hypothetical protein OSB04_008761 [Centaurea solstitialis]
MIFGTIAADSDIDVMLNSQQDSNFILPTSLTPAQLHQPHLVAPVEQTMIDGPSCKVHNLPFKLKTRARRGVVQRKLYICPEPNCAHHNRSHALGDFGGLKKHYLRKHTNQKKHECNGCPKKYAVETDLKAHLKICGKKKRSHFAFHQAFCDEEEHKDEANNPPTSDVGNSSDGSTSNNLNNDNNVNNNILIDSTKVDLPTFDMGDNNNNNSPSNNISSIETPFNTYASQLSQFGTDHESLITTTDPSLGLNLPENTHAFSSPSSTQENQLQGNHFDLGFYTNLLMNNNPYHNFDLNNVTFMGEEVGSMSNSFSGGGIMLDHSSSLHSTSVAHNATLRQQLSDPQLVLNEDLLRFASGTNSSYNMVQGGLGSFSSGFMMPQEHSLLGSKHFGIADGIGYNTNQNEVHNLVSDNVVGSSSFNEDDVDGSYMKGGYYGFGDGSHHGY